MNRMPRAGIAVLAVGAAVELVGPWWLARVARRAGPQDLLDCGEHGSTDHTVTTNSRRTS